MNKNTLEILQQDYNLSVADAYGSIYDLPFGRFERISKTGILTELLIDRKNYTPLFVKQLWQDINQQYFKLKGVPRHVEAYIQYMRQYVELKYEIHINGRKDKEIFARRARRNAEKYIKANAASNIYELSSQIGQVMGFGIDPETTSIILFEAHLKTALRNGKKN